MSKEKEYFFPECGKTLTIDELKHDAEHGFVYLKKTSGHHYTFDWFGKKEPLLRGIWLELNCQANSEGIVKFNKDYFASFFGLKGDQLKRKLGHFERDGLIIKSSGRSENGTLKYIIKDFTKMKELAVKAAIRESSPPKHVETIYNVNEFLKKITQEDVKQPETRTV